MFRARLRAWTVGFAGILREAARTFFYFLCALEEDDRKDQIIRWNWADLWRRLGRPEPAPEIMAALEPLATAALVEKQPDTEFGEDGFAVLIHPGVAEAGRCEAGAEFQRAVDLELATTWNTLMRTARDAYGKAPWAGGLIIRAGLAAFPYLARLTEWALASAMLQQVDQINIQASPAMLAAVLPRIRRVVAETTATERELIDRGVLARLQMKAGQTAEAEHELRAISEQAADRGEFRIASNMATDLANLLRDAGRYDDAMKIAERAAEYTRRGGFGPWTQLADEAQRLQILAERGDEEEVLRRVTELREQMKSLPDQSEAEEIIPSWNVRETILDVGRSAHHPSVLCDGGLTG